MSRRLSSSSPRASTSPAATSPAKSRVTIAADEITPLLRKASRSLSNTFYGDPRPLARSESGDDEDYEDGDANGRIGEEGSDDEIDGEGGREVEVYIPGRSTFMQTLLNCLADIVGTGLLACPIAIAHLGWVFGPLLLVLTGLVSLWTLKIMLRIIEKDRRLRSFTDVIGYGLGPIGEKVVTALFFSEFAIWIIALVVLFSDTLAVVWPIYSTDEWKIVGLIVIIPTSFLPLRYLAFSSGLGVISTYVLVGILIFSGIATPTSPGSLRDPAPTDLWPAHGAAKALVAIGLLVSGFGGHGLIPNLIRDMRHPKQADRMCETAYGIAMVIYIAVAVCGYLMYGRNVSDEISKDLARTPGFSPMLNNVAVWMVALNPLTKIPLGLRPFSDILFSYLHLHPTILIPESQKTPHVTRPSSLLSVPSATSSLTALQAQAQAHTDGLDLAAERQHNRRERAKYFLRPVIRLVLAVLVTVGALVMPSFESSMAILGGGFGVIMIIVLPVWAAGEALGWKRWYGAVIAASLVLAAAGTGAAIFTARDTRDL